MESNNEPPSGRAVADAAAAVTAAASSNIDDRSGATAVAASPVPAASLDTAAAIPGGASATAVATDDAAALSGDGAIPAPPAPSPPTSSSTSIIATTAATTPPTEPSATAASSSAAHSATTPPKISLPTGQHAHSTPAPQIGPGWTQQIIQRRTPSGPYGKVDRYFVTPRGRKLRSMAEVHRYLSSPGFKDSAGGGSNGSSNGNNSGNNGTSGILLNSGGSSGSVAGNGGNGNGNGNGNGGNNNSNSYKQLRISTGSVANSRSSSAVNSPRPPVSDSPRSPRPPPVSGPGSGKGIDVHPYSRGSVIEVRYVKRDEKVVKGDQILQYGLDGVEEEDGCRRRKGAINWEEDSHSDWFGSSSSEEEEEEEEEDDEDDDDDMDISDDDDDNDEKEGTKKEAPSARSSDKSNNSSSKADNNKEANKDANDPDSIYFADIIDRLPLHPNLPTTHPTQSFKYYIHYRNFNRRMDEWIGYDRIVSPPSVGNARVRSIKRKEDRRKRDEEEKRERENILKEGLERVGRRESGARNRSLDENLMGGGSGLDAGVVVTGGAGGSSAGGGGGSIARKRLRRAASTGEDLLGDATTHDNNATGGGGGAIASSFSSMAESEEAGTRLTRRQRAGGAVGISTSAGTATHVTAAETSSTMLQPPTSGEQPTAVLDQVTTIAAQILDEHEGMDAAALKEHEEVTKIKNVGTLELGKYQMDTWYFSPLPKELTSKENGGMIEVLYVDEFSLNFFVRKEELLRYQRKTLELDGGGGNRKRGKGGGRRHPPGNEIYRCGNLSMFEVDGFEERLYCQNLCYIAKLFLDHKTLYFDVDPFLFYVLCEVDERGYHPVGYYSKEKYSDVGYNLACILTFPSHQRKGYGRFLIAFSYELSKKEEKVGSPEKPMSDLGQQAYIPYWTSTIVDFLLHDSEGSKSMSIMDIAKKTSIFAEDVIFALNTLGILKFVNGAYFIYAERTHLEDLAKKHPVKEPRVDPSKLHWTPYITDVKRDKFSISSKKASIEC